MVKIGWYWCIYFQLFFFSGDLDESTLINFEIIDISKGSLWLNLARLNYWMQLKEKRKISDFFPQRNDCGDRGIWEDLGTGKKKPKFFYLI